MVRILAVDPADARDVAGDGDFVVGDALGHPDGAHLAAAAADDFEGPYFLLVRDRQAFAGVAVAVFLGRFAHQADGVARVVAAHERQAREFLDEEDRVLVDEGVRAGEGRFADGDLLLVQAGVARIDIGIGMADLWDFAHLPHAGGVSFELGVPQAFIDFEHVSGGVVRGGFHRDPRVRHAVAGVGGEDGAVRGREPAHHDAGAAFGLVAVGIDALGVCARRKEGCRRKEEESSGLHVCCGTFRLMYAFSCT